MKPPITLEPDQLSTDTIECLKQLLDQARRRKVIGIGFVAMYKHRRFIANTAGEAHRNPTWTRGMLRALDDQLGSRVRGLDR